MSRTTRNVLFTTATVGVALVIGWLMAVDVRERSRGKNRSPGAEPRRAAAARTYDAPNAASKPKARDPRRERPSIEEALFAVPKERLIRFASDADYLDFLRRLGESDLRLLGRLDRLRALRVGYDSLDDLYDLLGDHDDHFANYRVEIPLPVVEPQAGAIGFGTNTLAWLGVTGDNSAWGSGVRVAVLDTGVASHPAFTNPLIQHDLLPDGAETALHWHGTSVASLIVGDHQNSPGLAPAADLFSVRIADEQGLSNSFLLAEGILFAVDQGAQVINISMGSYGNSSIVAEAVRYASESGAVIIAAAGNERFEFLAFPAAYEGVISVGAVDANNNRMAFSNQGEGLGVSAPGYAVSAATLGDTPFTYFTGTSASAPLVSAAVAATASQFEIPIADAAQLVLSSLNEAGAPGSDPAFGGGILDMGRIMNSNVAGIYDAAVASHFFLPGEEGDPFSRVFVTVQNRGTEPLNNIQLDITVGDDTYPRSIPYISPGQIYTVERPVSTLSSAETLVVQSSVTIPGNISDSRTVNDSRQDVIQLVPPEAEGSE